MPYETWLVKKAPTWLQGPNGAAWLSGIGATKDFYVDQIRQAVLSSFPQYAPSDALGVLGDEIGLDRGPTESDGDYAARLVAAWIYWPLAGTPAGLLTALHFAGFDGGVIVQQNGLAYQLTLPLVIGDDPKPNIVRTPLSELAVALHSDVDLSRSIPAGDSWWTFDSDTDFCSRFAILFPSPPSPFITYARATLTGQSTAALTWNNQFTDASYLTLVCTPSGDGFVSTYVDGKTSTGATLNVSDAFTGTIDVIAWEAGDNPFCNLHAADLARLQSVVKKWRPAKATCVGVYGLVQGNFIGWPVRTIGAAAPGPFSIYTAPGSF